MSDSPRLRPKPEMSQYPRSIPAGMKNDVNSMRSVERNKRFRMKWTIVKIVKIVMTD